MRVLNIEEFGSNGITSFTHYIYIPDTTLSDSTLISTAQEYTDSLSINKPVLALIFVSSNDGFSQNPEDNELDKIRKNTFAEVLYSYQSHKQGNLRR